MSTAATWAIPSSGDSGRFVEHNTRNFVRVAPFFRYDVTQRQRLEFDAHYLRADFEKQFDGRAAGLQRGGRLGGLGLPVLRALLPDVARRSRRSTKRLSIPTPTAGMCNGTRTSPRTRASTCVPVRSRRNRRTARATPTSSRGIGGSWNSQRNTLFVDLTRTVEPISAGTVVERYQLRMQIHHDVSPRISLMLGARASRDEDHRHCRHVPDAQVRGGRRRLRVARAAQLRGDRDLQLSVAGVCG